VRSVCTAVPEMLDSPAHRMRAAADLGCKESAQRVYELLVRFSQGMAISWEGDFSSTDTSVDTAWSRNSELMDARAFHGTYTGGYRLGMWPNGV
jgi:hypothetical protein